MSNTQICPQEIALTYSEEEGIPSILLQPASIATKKYQKNPTWNEKRLEDTS